MEQHYVDYFVKSLIFKEFICNNNIQKNTTDRLLALLLPEDGVVMGSSESVQP